MFRKNTYPLMLLELFQEISSRKERRFIGNYAEDDA